MKIKLFQLVFISILIVLPVLSKAENTDKQELGQYLLEFEYAGTNENDLDSVFVVYAVFEKKQLKDISKIQVKKELSEYSYSIEEIDISDNVMIRQKLLKSYVRIGSAGADLKYIDIVLMHYNGNKMNVNFYKNK